MSEGTEVVSVNISTEKGTIKHPVDRIVLDHGGVVGDAHAGLRNRQVSLLGQESIHGFGEKLGRKFNPGEFAENITTRGIDLASVYLLDRFRIGAVELEVTQIGKKCHRDGCAIYRQVGECIMPKDGIFCRVRSGGSVRAGDPVEFLPKTLWFKIITLSDRAYQGVYQDRSGPRIKELVQSFMDGKRWHAEITTSVLPDDVEKLRQELSEARNAGADIIFTTGGTGVGPRDITPETVAGFCDKIIPGIMEAIRIRFGSEKPTALLSRSVAGVSGSTLVFALPGSTRAVEEYLGEITKTLEHLLFMLHELDVH